MMMNMFFIFDPNTSFSFQMNWTSSLINLLIFPLQFWFQQSRFMKLINFLFNTLNNEMTMILKHKFNFFNSIYFISLFMSIFFNNFFGIFPYIFTSTSHLSYSMNFSFPLWISLFGFTWYNYMNESFTHLIPQGTPLFLMPFMVLIETISLMIRPFTLAIRLTANMIAGHLLLTLLSQTAISSYLAIPILISLIQTLLLTLEFSVTIIQAYVFTMLSILYIKEATHTP